MQVLAPGVGLWLLDLLVRASYVRFTRSYTKTARIDALPADVIRITMPKSFEYQGGQYSFLCIPALSAFEWHPFSISSAPHEPFITYHVRVLGDWTQRLYVQAAVESEVSILVDGPYGSPTVDLDKYEYFLLVSGGVGVTPLQAVCNQLTHEHEERGRPLKKVYFIWAVRDQTLISALHPKDELGAENDPCRTSFVPNLVQSTRTSSSACSSDQSTMKEDPLLETQYYLTQGLPSRMTVLNQIDADFREGRPDLPAEFRRMHDAAAANGRARVAAMVCGPQKMIDEVRRLCLTESSSSVTFDFHGETFDF